MSYTARRIDGCRYLKWCFEQQSPTCNSFHNLIHSVASVFDASVSIVLTWQGFVVVTFYEGHLRVMFQKIARYGTKEKLKWFDLAQFVFHAFIVKPRSLR